MSKTYSREGGDVVDEVLADYHESGDVVTVVASGFRTARGTLASADADVYEVRSARSGKALLEAHRDEVEAVIV